MKSETSPSDPGRVGQIPSPVSFPQCSGAGHLPSAEQEAEVGSRPDGRLRPGEVRFPGPARPLQRPLKGAGFLLPTALGHLLPPSLPHGGPGQEGAPRPPHV